MYPLNVSLPAPAIGFAVANDVDEHQRLTEAGYQPAYVAPAEETKAPAVKTAKAPAAKQD